MKKLFLSAILLWICMSMLTGCDPILPTENIEADFSPKPFIQGTSADIEIIYPDTDGTAVVKWTDPRVEIVEGNEIVQVSGLTITALKPGNAKLKIEVKANCAFMGIVVDKPVFTTELEVEVADGSTMH